MIGQQVIGILLEIIAASLGTVSKQLIASTEYVQKISLKRCTLWFGVFLNVLVGPLVDASAYAFAPQTVIAPFASLDVLFNAMSAPCTLGWQRERFTWMHFAAAILVTGGAAAAAVFGKGPNTLQNCDELKQQLLRWQSLVYFTSESVALLVAVLIIRREDTGRVQGMALGGIAGLLMGNVFLVKGFVDILRQAIETGDWEAFTNVMPYVLLVGALAGSALGTYFMQWGLRKYKGVYMVTIFEGMHISSACLSGDIVMGEMAESSWEQWVAYWSSIACIVGGIALVNYVSDDVGLLPPEPLVRSIIQAGSTLYTGSVRRASLLHTASSQLDNPQCGSVTPILDASPPPALLSMQ